MADREKRPILVVDGSSSLLFYMGMLLKRLEYEVFTATTAEEAFQIMARAFPSLVITDISLPKMNGMAMLKKMRQDPRFKAIPVIIHTSENDEGMKDTCLRAGCTAYLKKPAEPDGLYRAIQAATETMPRQHIRLGTSLTARVGDGSVLGGAARTEYVTAISEGGAYVRTFYPQPVNTVVPLRILVGDREVKAKAVVLYNFTVGEGPFKEPGMGMKFVEISDDDRDAVRTFIKERLTSDISRRENE